MQERTSLEDSLGGIGKVERELEDNIGMIELGEAENDETVVADAEAALKALKKEVARRELEALLGGEADRFDSYLEVHAGAGGTESQDWAAMLLRMYTRWAEKHGFKIEYMEETQGEEAGIKSATIQISGHNAFIALGLAERDHLDIVVEFTLDLADAFKRIHQRGALLHQLLGLLGIVPEIGIFGEFVQLGEASRGLFDVKDASSAARLTA